MKHDGHHCWHITTIVTFNPPTMNEVCCWCGTVRGITPGIPPGHGNYTPPDTTIKVYTYIKGVDPNKCPANNPQNNNPGIKIVRAGQGDGHPTNECSFCGILLVDYDDRYPTSHVTRGYVTLCRACYNQAGNDVR